MKRIIAILTMATLIVCMLAMFTGCDDVQQENQEPKPNLSDRFEEIDTVFLTNDTYITVYYDKQTGVMYQFIDGYKAGGASVMYNSDGTVMIYDKYAN